MTMVCAVCGIPLALRECANCARRIEHRSTFGVGDVWWCRWVHHDSGETACHLSARPK